MLCLDLQDLATVSTPSNVLQTAINIYLCLLQPPEGLLHGRLSLLHNTTLSSKVSLSLSTHIQAAATHGKTTIQNYQWSVSGSSSEHANAMLSILAAKHLCCPAPVYGETK